MKKLKKLVLKKEVIASLSNPEMSMVVGGQDSRAYVICPLPPDGTVLGASYQGYNCPTQIFPTVTCPTGRANTCSPRCCDYGCCETIGC